MDKWGALASLSGDFADADFKHTGPPRHAVPRSSGVLPRCVPDPTESITAAKHVFRHGDLGIRLLLDTERAADLVDNVRVGGRDAAANGLLADGIGALPAPAPGKSL